MRDLYRMWHSYFRRALNAGAKGYLEMNLRGGDWNDESAYYAAQAAVRASGRQPAATFNRALFNQAAYVPAS